MRPVAFTLAFMLCGPGELAFAQAHDPVAQSGASATGRWILSETTSPVNYGPLVIATVPSRPDSEGMASLSISCRGGRTELVVTDIDSLNRGRRTDDVMITHQVANQSAVQERWKVSATGKGAVFAGDVVRFLRSLPDEGEMSLRLFDSRGMPHDAWFPLDGLSVVRSRVAAACKWPGTGVPGQ